MLLGSIPDVCIDCFDEAARMAAPIFKSMIDARGADCLNQAQTVWAKNPTKAGAQEAASLEEFFAVLPRKNYTVGCYRLLNHARTAPYAYVVEKVR